MFPDIPTRLTERDLAAYKDQGYEVLFGRETPQYRREWGMWEAIRDLVQNALDETENFSLSRSGGDVLIRDTGGGFGVRAFLLGQPTPKPDYMRGRYGEGMKIAAIAILREGHRFSFETSGQGRPIEGAACFVTRPVFGEEVETLTFLVRRAQGPVQGTAIRIRGYTGELFKDRFAGSWQPAFTVEDPLLTTPVQRYDSIYAGSTGLGPPSVAGYVFARDLFMRKEKTGLSYNLWGFKMAPDRFGLTNERDYHVALGALWSSVAGVNLIRYFLQQVASDDGEAFEKKAIMWRAGLIRRQPFWAEAWKREFGQAAILLNSSLTGRLAHWGYRAVQMPSELAYSLTSVIESDRAALKRLGEDLNRNARPVSVSSVSSQAVQHLNALKYISKELLGWDPSINLAGRAAPTLVPVVITQESGRLVGGYYDQASNTIGLQADSLESFRSALDVFIHEYAHFLTGRDDGAEEHTKAISLVGAIITQFMLENKLPAWVMAPVRW